MPRIRESAKKALQGGRSLPQGQGSCKHGKGPAEAEIAVICAFFQLCRALGPVSAEAGRIFDRARGWSAMKDDGQDGGRPAGKAAKDARQERLKLALRENLKRRKSQARGRGDFMPA
jgi:hypothetical protein